MSIILNHSLLSLIICFLRTTFALVVLSLLSLFLKTAHSLDLRRAISSRIISQRMSKLMALALFYSFHALLHLLSSSILLKLELFEALMLLIQNRPICIQVCTRLLSPAHQELKEDLFELFKFILVLFPCLDALKFSPSRYLRLLWRTCTFCQFSTTAFKRECVLSFCVSPVTIYSSFLLLCSEIALIQSLSRVSHQVV